MILQTDGVVSATPAPEMTLARPASENSNVNLDMGEENRNRQIGGFNMHPKNSAFTQPTMINARSGNKERSASKMVFQSETWMILIPVQQTHHRQAGGVLYLSMTAGRFAIWYSFEMVTWDTSINKTSASQVIRWHHLSGSHSGFEAKEDELEKGADSGGDTWNEDLALDLLLSAQDNADMHFLSEISLWTNYREN